MHMVRLSWRAAEATGRLDDLRAAALRVEEGKRLLIRSRDYRLLLGRPAPAAPYQARRRHQPAPEPTRLQQVGNVARSVARAAASMAATRLDASRRATDEQIKARLDVCRQCPGGHATFHADGSLNTCGPMLQSMREAGRKTCGCILTEKARDVQQDCPNGWWGPRTATTAEGE